MSIDQFSAYKPGFNLLDFFRREPTGPKAMENARMGTSNYKPSDSSTPWMQRKAFGDFNKGDMLMAGLGMLSGRNLQDGFGNVANVAGYAMDRNTRKAEQEDRNKLLMQAMGANDPKKQRDLLGQAYPEAVGESMANRAFAPPPAPDFGFQMGPDGSLIRTDGASGTANVMGERGQYAKPAQPVSTLGKLASDYKAGLISEEEYRAGVEKANAQRGPLVSVNTGDMPSKDTLTPFQLKQDQIYAETLAEWNTGGGVDAIKNLDQINGVADKLESGDGDLTGWLIGNTPDWILAGINPDAMDAKDLVEEVVQRNLRVVLGAQFTEKEGERLIARAYNPSLDEKINAARLRRLVTLIEGRAQQLNSLNDYTRTYGTSSGWDGSLMSVDAILSELDAQSGGANSPKAGQKRLKWNPATGEFE